MDKDSIINNIEEYIRILNSNFSSKKKKMMILDKLFDGNYDYINDLGTYQLLFKNLNNKATLNLIGDYYADRILDLDSFFGNPIIFFIKMNIVTDTFIEAVLNKDISYGLMLLLRICNGKGNANDILYKFSNYASKKLKIGIKIKKSKSINEDFLSDEVIKFLVENIPNNRLIDYLTNRNIPKKVKDYLMKMRKDDIEEILSKRMYPFYDGDCPDEIQDKLIMRIPSDDLLGFLSDDTVSTKLKDRVFELRKEDVLKVKIGDEDIFNLGFDGKYFDYLLSNKKGDYIFRLLIYPYLSNDKKKIILRSKGEELKKYFYRNLDYVSSCELAQDLHRDKIWQDEENKELQKYLLELIEINGIMYNNKLDDIDKLDKILTYDDEQVIGILLRYYAHPEYRYLLKEIYLRRKEAFNNYFRNNSKDIIILKNLGVKLDDIKGILEDVPCLPIFISALHENPGVWYDIDKSNFIDDILSFIYMNNNNRSIINEYLGNNPEEYLYLADKNNETLNLLLNNLSEKNVIFLLFEMPEENFIKPIIFEIKKDYVIKYLNENPNDILHVTFFVDANTFMNELLPNLNDIAVINLLCNKKIISDELYKDDKLARLFKLLFEDRKNKIFEYLDNNNMSYDFLLYYDLSSNDITNILAKITDERLINIFVKFGKRIFNLKEDTLNVIYRNKKDLILKEFINNNDRFSFILNLEISEEDFNNIINELDNEILKKMINDKIYPSEVQKKVLERLLIKNNSNFHFDGGLVDDMFAVWDIMVTKKNDTIIINNFEKIIKFMDKCNLNFSKMLQYEANVEYDWIKGILDIIQSDKTDVFAIIKEHFYSFYFNFDGSESEILYYESFLLLIENFQRYPNLCLDIADNILDLTAEEKNKISFLFGKKEIFPIAKTSELKNINNLIKNKYLSILSNLDEVELSTMKNSISLIIFNSELKELESFLKRYGSRQDFIKLKFDNRNNEKILDYIDEILIYISLIEDFVNCNNMELLQEMAKNVLNNFDEIIDISTLFNSLEKKMRELFEMEANINLTNLYDERVYNNALNKELSNKYLVDVLDFRDKQYLFYEHQMSNREIIEDLVKGKSTGNSNFISLIPISHRKNNYYLSWSNKLKLIYCVINKGSYIMSSLHNMNSNSFLRKNKAKVENVFRYQRGILETSDADEYNNSETLCYREGLVPIGINITGDEDEKQLNKIIKTARKYGLKLILTQGANKTISNPKKDYYSSKNLDVNRLNLGQIKELRDKLNILSNFKPKSNTRRVAILTDPHALFGPTLAILEDARRKGITEIYSLGDNIGTGPNPGEVVDLLESYGVKSVKGNHELYTLLGTESFKKHLHGETLKEAEENSAWTRLHLNDRQLEIIRNYPDKIELEINGKKVLLTHYIKNFNTNKAIFNKKEYDKIFQGHIHFSKDVGNIKTLRGAGIGSNSDNGGAYYIILTENDDSGFDIEEVNVSFDSKSLYHDINESDLSEHDKNKITGWSGASRK